jgi:hypothetical protein
MVQRGYARCVVGCASHVQYGQRRAHKNLPASKLIPL